LEIKRSKAERLYSFGLGIITLELLKIQQFKFLSETKAIYFNISMA